MGESVTKLSAAYRFNAASVAETISLSSLKRSPANDPEEFSLNYKSPVGKLPRESVDSKMPATVPTATVFPGSIFSKLSAIDNRKVLRYSFFKQSYQSSERACGIQGIAIFLPSVYAAFRASGLSTNRGCLFLSDRSRVENSL